MRTDEAQIMQEIDEFVKANRENIQRDIGRLVAVRSVRDMDSAAPGAPFGAGARAALDVALDIARELGLETQDGDGYVGWAQLGGQREGHLATITHVDVVPEGEGWTGSAYELREQDGWLMGRGVLDDKGPTVLCLYLAKFFAQAKEAPRYGLRMLIGCDEESGMGDVEHYLAHNPQPLFCFTPDADFPLGYGEKGLQNGELVSGVLQGGRLLAFEGGIAGNVIPDRASCLVRAGSAQARASERVAVSQEKDALRLTASGIGGHAAEPEGTLNAIGLLVDYLLANGLCSAEEESFLRLLQRLHSATDGSGLGIACSDEIFTPLTINGGVISLKDGLLRQSIDIRYPTTTSYETLRTKLAAEAQAVGGSFESERGMEPFVTPVDSEPVQALLQAYRSVTGNVDAEPFTMGGGTYARHFERAVSFGPEEKGAKLPEFAGPIHGANEGVQADAMMQALRVYIFAVWKLMQLELGGG